MASLAVAELVDDGIAFSGGIVFSGVRSGELGNGKWVGDSMIVLLFLTSSWAFFSEPRAFLIFLADVSHSPHSSSSAHSVFVLVAVSA